MAWLFGAFVATAAMAEEGAWSKHILGSVELELPVPVTATRETKSWGLGTTETDRVEAAVFGGWMAAHATQAPATAVMFAGHPLIHVTTRKHVLQARGGTLTAWEDVKRQGVSGKRMAYDVTRGERTLRGVMEVYVVGSVILTFDALLPEDAPKHAARRFFRSIDIEELVEQAGG